MKDDTTMHISIWQQVLLICHVNCINLFMSPLYITHRNFIERAENMHQLPFCTWEYSCVSQCSTGDLQHIPTVLQMPHVFLSEYMETNLYRIKHYPITAYGEYYYFQESCDLMK